MGNIYIPTEIDLIICRLKGHLLKVYKDEIYKHGEIQPPRIRCVTCAKTHWKEIINGKR